MKIRKIDRLRIRNGMIFTRLLMVAGILFGIVFGTLEAEAATVDFGTKLIELQKKFPQGKYWNKVGLSSDNSDGYTDSPCALHKKIDSNDHVYDRNGCTCNHFADQGHLSATQCMGFANKLGHDVFGDTAWTKINSPTTDQIADIRVGDIVRMDYNSHSVFVIARVGNEITVGEANYSGHCQISWDRKIDLSTANITYYERAANYSDVIGGTSSDVPAEDETKGDSEGNTAPDAPQAPAEDGLNEEPQVPADYTGWMKTADGTKEQYYLSGELQKNKWITIKKKRYYVDKSGYKVTGFYDIDTQTYYFNKKGVMQKNKWFTLENETYHANTTGVVLKSQWLYYKGVLVYVTEDGSIAKNEIVKIGSKQYYFNEKGKRSKGFQQYNGAYYYTDAKGIIQKKKWVTKGGKKYYLQKSGVRAESKLLKIGKYRYYFNKKGQMVKNKSVTYKGKVYKANKKGYCKLVETKQESNENVENPLE